MLLSELYDFTVSYLRSSLLKWKFISFWQWASFRLRKVVIPFLLKSPLNQPLILKYMYSAFPPCPRCVCHVGSFEGSPVSYLLFALPRYLMYRAPNPSILGIVRLTPVSCVLYTPYPGILWLAPLVDVPAARCPSLSMASMPEPSYATHLSLPLLSLSKEYC